MISLAMAFLAQIMIMTIISNATASPREIEMERMISVHGSESAGQSGRSGQTGQSGHSTQVGHTRGFSEE